MSEVPQEISALLKNICKEKNLTNYRIQIHKGNNNGEGYIGEIIFLTIIDDDEISKTKLDLVVKKAFNSERVRKKYPLVRASFLNEIYVYAEVLPAFTKFQQDKNVKRIFDTYVKCYKMSSTNLHELLILENMKPKGFNVIDRRELLNAQQVELILKNYGRYHAISFAFKQQHPEEFSKFQESLQNLYELFEANFFDSVFEVVDKMLIPGKDDLFIRKLGKYFIKGAAGKAFEESHKYSGKNAVISHGDCWSNNIMFKNDANGKSTEMKMIDWQFARSASPVYDLSYLLYSGAPKEIFDNLEHYLKLYHNSLTDYLLELGGNPAEFTFEDLKSDWKQFSEFGFLLGILVCKMKLHSSEESNNLDDLTGDQMLGDSFALCSYDEKLFEERARNLIAGWLLNETL